MKRKLRILVAPLDWGLGHASRSVKIIRSLEKENVEVIIGADNQSLIFLKKEFPHLDFLKFPSIKITYSKKLHQSLHLLKSAPAMIKSIINEHKLLDRIIEEKKIDGVISDNRYGLWSNKVPTVFITHQLNIKAPDWLCFGEKLLNFFVKKIISKYTFCWIPDCPKWKLSGDLANRFSLPQNALYIGFISRFSKNNQVEKDAIRKKYNVAAIISGPEPQRTMFEKKIISELKNTNFKSIIVRGLPEKNKKKSTKYSNIDFFSHLPSNSLKYILENTPHLIMRSGYSSLMDLIALDRKAILVPTPKQSEQEYLAKYLKEKKAFFSMPQKKFNLNYAIKESKNYQTKISFTSPTLLENAIEIFLSKCKNRML